VSKAKITEYEFAYEAPDTAGDNMTVLSRDGSLFDFEIEEPWAGCTETGFGERCDLSLPREEAVALARWILARAGEA
jgi:hypothetical protein